MSDTATVSGIPHVDAYMACLRSALFREMETFSQDFLRRNRARLFYYGLRWSHDPLHNATRQWEYPFVYERVERSQGTRVLDAGSGVTFFPYFLMDRQPNVQVTCCDRDAYVGRLHGRLDRGKSGSVKFCQCDLAATPFESGQFDVVYCVSVLEHTSSHEAVVREFKRILRPGGRLVVTYDVSLDGRKQIPLAQAVQLHKTLRAHLSPADAPEVDATSDRVMTSDFGSTTLPSSSLWDAYRRCVHTAKEWLGRSAGPSRMTVYCAEFDSPG